MAVLKPSPFVGQLTGSLGNVAFRNTPTGVQMVVRQASRDPRTPAQRAVRMRMARAAALWKSMSLAQAAAWRAYAESRAEPMQPAPIAFNLFSALAVRVLAVNPAATVPLLPPAQPFAGDAVRVRLAAGSSAVEVSVDAGNSPGVVTEFLLQPLASIHRAAYAEKYRSAGIFELVAGRPVSLACRLRPGGRRFAGDRCRDGAIWPASRTRARGGLARFLSRKQEAANKKGARRPFLVSDLVRTRRIVGAEEG